MRVKAIIFCAVVSVFYAFFVHRSPGPAGMTKVTVQALPAAARVASAEKDRTPLPPVLEQPAVPVTPGRWEDRFCEIANQPVALQSQEELEELADSIPEVQVPAALAEISSDRSGAGAIVGRRLVWRWAEKSPEAAAQWASGLADNDFAHVIYRQIASSWAGKDLNGALAWVQQQPEGGNKTAASLSLAYEAGLQNKTATVMDLATNLPAGAERNQLLDYSVRQWAAVDAGGAAGWVQQSVNGDSREQMLGEIATESAIQNPFQAADFVATTMTNGPARDRAVAGVVQLWAAAAPRDAAAWVEEFPEGGQRDTLVLDLLETWAKGDFDGARDWVEQMPAGNVREAAMDVLAHAK